MADEENEDLIYDKRGTCFMPSCGIDGKKCPDCAMGHNTKYRNPPVPKLEAYQRIKAENEKLKAEHEKLFAVYLVAREIYPLRHLALPIEDGADDPLILFNKIKRLSGPLKNLIELKKGEIDEQHND